jgi:hypothetical protein
MQVTVRLTLVRSFHWPDDTKDQFNADKVAADVREDVLSFAAEAVEANLSVETNQ